MAEAGEAASNAFGNGNAMLSAAFVQAEALLMLNAVQAQQHGTIARQAATIASCARVLGSASGDSPAADMPGVSGLTEAAEFGSADNAEPSAMAKTPAKGDEAAAAPGGSSAQALQLAASIAVHDAVDYLRSATSFATALRASAAVCEAAEKGSGAAQWSQADAIVESALAHLQNVSKLAESLVRAAR